MKLFYPNIVTLLKFIVDVFGVSNQNSYLFQNMHLRTTQFKCSSNNFLTFEYYRFEVNSSKNRNSSICIQQDQIPLQNTSYHIKCEDATEVPDHIMLSSLSFWIFVLLMSVGTIAFNVVNSVSDAICFDVIGE